MNKLVIITGGSKGIGRALVHQFASAEGGFDIITCARDSKQLKVLENELNSAYSSRIQFYGITADLSQKKDVDRFIEYVHKINRPIEILINNIGTYTPGQIHSEPEGMLEKMINTNLFSAYHVSRGIVPKMMHEKHGYIFNICSTASITPYVNGGSYCVSKYALYGMTKVLREEMKEHNIKVTAVLPGATRTSSWDGVDLPNTRFIQPEDVAKSIFDIYKLSGSTIVEEILIRPQLGDII